jgi:hypothetical protein
MIARLLLPLLLAGCATTFQPAREWDFSTGRVRFTNVNDVPLERVSVSIARSDRNLGVRNAQVRSMSGDIVTRIEPNRQVEIVSPEADLMIQQKRPFSIYLLYEIDGLREATVVGHYPPLR